MWSLARRLGHAAGAAALLAGGALAQTTTRESVNALGVQGDGFSLGDVRSISSDARYVAFASSGSHLVPVDTNGVYDVFVHDVLGGATIRVSVDSSGMQGDGMSTIPSISADGLEVAFESEASNLVPGDTNATTDIFVHDVQTGRTTRASADSSGIQGNGRSRYPSISADGSCVAFLSDASNLVAGDTNATTDIFVRDLQSGATTRISVDSTGAQGNGSSSGPSISADGRYVAFTSHASNLVPADTNGHNDVFVHDRLNGTTVRASVSSTGVQGFLDSDSAVISSDGRRVAFASRSGNLIPGDTNQVSDVLVRDLQAGTTTRVSVSSDGLQSNDISFSPAISADGRFVAFASNATNLVPGDTNGYIDIFVHDLQIGETTRVSVSSSGGQANSLNEHASISPEGRFVCFDSYADNLVPGDTNGFSDLFLRDRGVASAFVAYCSGDGVDASCPCGNLGAADHGCENSAGTGGARLTASGVASLSADTVQLTSSGELPTAFSIVVQGDGTVPPLSYGDGVRCTAGLLKRLYKRSAVGGVLTAPQGADLSISAESAAVGDPILLGTTRNYQVFYRDANPTFCPPPSGSTFNMSNAIAIAWGA